MDWVKKKQSQLNKYTCNLCAVHHKLEFLIIFRVYVPYWQHNSFLFRWEPWETKNWKIIAALVRLYEIEIKTFAFLWGIKVGYSCNNNNGNNNSDLDLLCFQELHCLRRRWRVGCFSYLKGVTLKNRILMVW